MVDAAILELIEQQKQYKLIMQQSQQRMEKLIESIREQFSSIRTTKASSHSNLRLNESRAADIEVLTPGHSRSVSLQRPLEMVPASFKFHGVASVGRVTQRKAKSVTLCVSASRSQRPPPACFHSGKRLCVRFSAFRAHVCRFTLTLVKRSLRRPTFSNTLDGHQSKGQAERSVDAFNGAFRILEGEGKVCDILRYFYEQILPCLNPAFSSTERDAEADTA